MDFRVLPVLCIMKLIDENKMALINSLYASIRMVYILIKGCPSCQMFTAVLSIMKLFLRIRVYIKLIDVFIRMVYFNVFN